MRVGSTVSGENATIDLFPGYVRIDWRVHRISVSRSAEYTSLTPSPMNDSTCLATSQLAAEQYSLLTLTKCARIASQLRLAATADFLRPGGALHELQRVYGGFRFKKALTVDAGSQYDALNRGDADVAAAFTTDAEIAENHLIVLGDDKHAWQRYAAAPFIRLATLSSHPGIRAIPNRISRSITTYAVQQMNMRLSLLHMEPSDLAEYFFQTHHLTLPR